MAKQIILFAIFFCNAGINHLSAVNQPYTDSLIHRLHNNLSKSDSETYELLCQIAENSSDASAILKYSELAISMAKKIEVSQARPIVSRGLGYLQSGMVVLALENFMEAARIYKADKNIIGLGTVYSYISEAYKTQGHHSNTTYYLKQAIEIFSSEKDSLRLASAMHNLGHEFYSTGKYDSALIIYKETGKIYQKLTQNEGYAYCIGNSGLVYSRMGKFSEAEKSLLQAIEILDYYGDEFAITDFMVEYSNVLQQMGEITKAIDYASRAFSLANSNNIMERKRDASKRLASLYASTRNFDSAFYYQSMYIAVSDSIRNLETIQKMADLRTEFEVSGKQTEVDVLQKKKAIQRIVIGSLILIIILAAWLIYNYYTSLVRNKKLTQVLDERRKLMEKQSAELKELNRIKDKFFSIISHDLKSPISSLGGISILLKQSLLDDNKAILTLATDFIDTTILTLTDLLDNLLNWAQSQQGKLKYEPELLDINELISDVVRLFSTLFLTKEIHVELNLEDNLSIVGDKNAISLIFRNLLSNAVKFTPKGGSIIISTKQTHRGFVEIAFQDNGVGIPEEKIATIFEFSDNKSTLGTLKEKGTGLGLILVKEFVSKNSGEICVESLIGEGTSFIVRFPVGTG